MYEPLPLHHKLHATMEHQGVAQESCKIIHLVYNLSFAFLCIAQVIFQLTRVKMGWGRMDWTTGHNSICQVRITQSEATVGWKCIQEKHKLTGPRQYSFKRLLIRYFYGQNTHFKGPSLYVFGKIQSYLRLNWTLIWKTKKNIFKKSFCEIILREKKANIYKNKSNLPMFIKLRKSFLQIYTQSHFKCRSKNLEFCSQYRV